MQIYGNTPLMRPCIDAGYLAQFYTNDLLTIVQPPDAEQEQPTNQC